MENLIDALKNNGAQVWEKNGMSRLYINNRSVLIAAIDELGVEKRHSISLKEGKTKSFIDLNNEVFFADDGSVANAVRNDLEMEVRRL